MTHIGVSSHEARSVRFEQSNMLILDDHGPERGIATTEPFGHSHQVGHNVPMLDPEQLACAAETCHHLVGDEQDSIRVADPANLLEVSCGRRDSPECCSDNWLCDK